MSEAFDVGGIVEAFNARLDAARYVAERLHFTAFVRSILAGEMPAEAINEEMRKAMENFDGIIEAAASGAYGERHAVERAKQTEGRKDYHAEYLKLVGQARIKAAAKASVNG